MSKLNFLVFLNTYSDAASSNAPALSNFKWARELTGIPASNPVSATHSLAPGESKSLFNGTRTLNSDNTTEYSIALKPLSTQNYRITNTGGAAPNFRTPRAISTGATTQVTTTVNGPIVMFSAAAAVPAQPAQFVGQIGGMTTPVTIVALTAGAAGNVTLPIDGVSSINQLIVGWNTANPSNQLQLQLGDDSQVPTGGQFVLTGGSDAMTGMDMTNVQVGDHVRIGTQFNVLNQGEYKILAKSANSFTVENQTAVNEGPITLGSGFADQIQIYSAAGVQVGDTLVLSSGFSAVTLGSYKVTDVAANWVEFYSTDVLPVESGIVNPGLAIYSAAKQLVYMEADQKTAITVNGSLVSNLEPFIILDDKQPGVFMLKSTVYSLSIQNLALDTASVFIATVE
jgi:hypothetical protein